MSLLTRKSSWPTLGAGSLISDFFDNDQFLNSPWLRGQSLPAVNIKENENSYDIELAVPGFEKSDFKVAIENRLLTISGEKKSEAEKKEDNYTKKEFEYSSFSRSFSLPENVNDEDVKARYENGVLKLSVLKKREASKPKKAIDIQ